MKRVTAWTGLFKPVGRGQADVVVGQVHEARRRARCELSVMYGTFPPRLCDIGNCDGISFAAKVLMIVS